jgi:predicted nucleic acid-binding protein
LRTFVLDASVALRWFLDRSVPPFAARVKQLLLAGSRALVPALWHLEMANALAVAERRTVLASDDVDRAAADIEQLLLQALDVDSAVVSVRQSLATARSFHLSAYDAAYLDLARREKLPLATLDDHLRAAATRAGVTLLR